MRAKDSEERLAEIRRKLEVTAVLTKQKIAALASEARERHQGEIDAYLLALRNWEKGTSGSSCPNAPNFLSPPKKR